jgi:amino acid adenylation domain-containing protein
MTAKEQRDGLGDPDGELNQIMRITHGAELPLSLAQERVWFYDLVDPIAPFHNVPRLLSIEGPLDPALLERAMNRIIERHDILRCTYHERAGHLAQRLHDRMTITVPVIDLRHLPSEPREAELDRVAAKLVSRPFDIATGPLMRGHLIRMEDRRYVLLLDFHHIVCDGWSERNTLDEIAVLYDAYAAGRPDPLPPLPFQYADYAVWQRRRLSSPAVAGHHEYWRAKLGDSLPTISLPTDHPYRSRRSYQGSSLGYELPDDLSAALRALAREQNATLYMLMLGAFFILMHRYTAQDDIVIGSPVNNRERSDIHDLIGYLVTRLPLRVDLSGDPSFVELLRQVRRTVLEAFEHKETTAERWPYPRDDEQVRESSNYQVMFFFQENPVGLERRFGGLVMTNANAHSSSRISRMGLRSPTLGSQLDLGFFLEPVGDRVFGWIEFNTDIFDRATVDRMRRHYLNLLRSIVADPQLTISSLNLLDAVERRELTPRLETTAPSGTEKMVLHRLLEAQCERTPDALAIDGEAQLTFQELDHRANALAHQLGRAGIGPGSVVSLVLPRSADLLVAMVAVLKSGAACLPLNLEHPEARLRRVILDTSSQSHGMIALVRDQDRHQFEGLPGLLISPSGERADTAPAVDVDESSLAFLFVTSGSTGEPKVVEVPHGAAAAGQLPDLVEYRLGEHDALLVTTPPSSIRLLGECFWPWLGGARVVVPPVDGPLLPRELVESVRRYGVTTMSILPSVLQQVLEEETLAGAERLALLLCLGEPLPTWLVRKTTELLPATKLVNSYAQTEACPGLFRTCTSAEEGLLAPLEQATAISVGYVLDGHLEPVPAGVPGDLYIAGATVNRGYRGRPAETAATFLPDPFSGLPGARMFRTGDRARHLQGGLLEFLGRLDNRVKVQGHSVALEEVESALQEDAEIKEVMVLAYLESDGDHRLVAYVVPRHTATFHPEAARRGVAERLPRHMVPSRLAIVEALARTATGKLDRSLPPAPPPTERGSELVAPRTQTEERIARLWASVLNVPRVGVFESFFDLGGTSLAGIRLVSLVGREFRLRLSIRALLDGGTVAGMAIHVEEALRRAEETDTAKREELRPS